MGAVEVVVGVVVTVGLWVRVVGWNRGRYMKQPPAAATGAGEAAGEQNLQKEAWEEPRTNTTPRTGMNTAL